MFAASRPVALRGTDLSLGYHDTVVVHEASVELQAGEVTALVGPNGSGKSTLLRALARLHRVSGGDVCLEGEGGRTDIATLTARELAREVTLLSQSRPSPNGLAVRDVVAFGRHPHRRRFASLGPEDYDAIDWALTVTGTDRMMGRAVDELSGGELQRVWLATCLAQRTGILLLDEPTNHLDLRYQVEILDLVRDLADDHGVAIGIVLHDLDQAAAVADRVVLLQTGRVRSAGTPREVLTSELVSEVYGLPVDVSLDPRTGRVRTHPRGRHHVRRSQPVA
jgi:ferric hydroxamate transport system ATP-binding protein